MPIYLPRDEEHTFENSPDTILIGNICYEKDAVSAIEPDALWADVVDEFDTCDDCEATSIEYEPCTPPPEVCSSICFECDNNCSDGSSINIIVSGFTVGDCINLNGSGTIDFVNGCLWEGGFFAGPEFRFYRLSCINGGPSDPNGAWKLEVDHSAEFESSAICDGCCLFCNMDSGHPTGSGTFTCGGDTGNFILT